VREPQQIDHQLDGVAGTVPAHVDDPLRVAHRLEHRPHPREHHRLAADEDLQRAGPRSGRHPAHRRVQDRDVAGNGMCPDPVGHRRDARGHVHPDGAGPHRVEQRAAAEQHVLDVARGRQHRDHHVRAGAGLPGRAGPGGPGTDQGVGCRRAHVVHRQVEARGEDARAHRRAHVPQADEAHPQASSHRATASSSTAAPSPGSRGTRTHPSASIHTGSARKKSRRCGVQPGGS